MSGPPGMYPSTTNNSLLYTVSHCPPSVLRVQFCHPHTENGPRSLILYLNIRLLFLCMMEYITSSISMAIEITFPLHIHRIQTTEIKCIMEHGVKKEPTKIPRESNTTTLNVNIILTRLLNIEFK